MEVQTLQDVIHEECFAGIDCFLDSLDFIHHLLVDSESSGGIDNHEVVAVSLGVVYGAASNTDRVFNAVLGVNVHPNRLCQNFELVNSGRAIYVACYKERTHRLLCLEFFCELAGESGLTRTLKARHEYYGGAARYSEGRGVATHKACELVVHDFNHELARLDSVYNVLAEGFLFYGVGKCLGDLVVDVGVDKGAAHIFESFGYVYLGDSTLTFKKLETALKAVAKFFEHGLLLY